MQNKGKEHANFDKQAKADGTGRLPKIEAIKM